MYLEQGNNNNNNNIINIFSRGALCFPLAGHVSVRLFDGYEPRFEPTLKPIFRGDHEGDHCKVHVSFNMSIALHLCYAVSVVKGSPFQRKTCCASNTATLQHDISIFSNRAFAYLHS